MLAVIALTVLVGTSMPITASAYPGAFCLDPGYIRAVGSLPQSPIHVGYFIPKAGQLCPAESGLILYDPLGDAAAINAMIRRDLGGAPEPNVLFAVDLPMTAAEKQEAENDVFHPFRPILSQTLNHFPIYVNGIAIGYNLSSCNLTTPLKLTPRTLSLIYSGGITTWSDQLLILGDPSTNSDDNPGLAGCGLGIDVAKREDIATSTNVLKDYLSAANPIFNALKVRELTQVWPPTLPTGCRAIGDPGMSTCLATPGTIGYVLYQEAYAKTNYKMAELQNIGGEFAAPATNVSATSARKTYPDNCSSAAAAAATSLPPTQVDWSRVTLTNTTVGYPLCQFSYLLGYSRPEAAMSGIGPSQVRTMVDYLTDIARDDVQDGLKARQVSPLPPAIRTLLRNGITLISP